MRFNAALGNGNAVVAGGNRVKVLDNDPGQARELADEEAWRRG